MIPILLVAVVLMPGGRQAGITPPQVNRMEQSLVIQSRQLRRAWGTPLIRFVPASSPHQQTVYLVGDAFWMYCNCDGYHSVGARPYAYVAAGSGPNDWRVTWSHEEMEMLEDPQTVFWPTNPEICDAVRAAQYTLLGEPVQDFVYPDYFRGRSSGPYDYMRVVNRPWGSVPGFVSSPLGRSR